MISKSLNTIFIHVNKTGGTSVSIALRPWEFLPAIAGDHDPAIEICNQMLKKELIFSEFWSFSIVRNPWDRMVSSYYYRQQLLEKTNKHFIPLDLSFSDWMTHKVLQDPCNYEWINQSLMLVDKNGKIMVDDIFFFENLEEAWKRITDRLGLKVFLSKANKTEREDFRTYYTDETAQIVADRFADDIKLFGYKFDQLSPF